MLKLMLITNDVDLASHAFDSGVARIFVDLEINGKYERQGHLDTLISKHSFEDISAIREAVPHCELIVRINPFYPKTNDEIEEVIKRGADYIMLPMFTSAEEISNVCTMIGGRVKFIPLIETSLALENLELYISEPGVSEIYLGLNDLHLDMGMKFMFEPLKDGLVDRVALLAKQHKKNFGFGGIARLGEGMLPADVILGEHERLNSNAVILSRTFHRRSESLDDITSFMCLHEEIDKIVNHFKALSKRTEIQRQEDAMILRKKIEKIVRGL